MRRLHVQRPSAVQQHQSVPRSAHRHHYHRTKDQYLHANYHFQLDPTHGPYDSLLWDPDEMADWDDIAEVRLLSPEPYACPICLSPPVAARLARCGHVICLSCILRASAYAGSDALSYAPCPLCGQPIVLAEMRSACLAACVPLQPAAAVRMALLCRQRESCIPVPSAAAATGAVRLQLPCGTDPGALFSRFSLAARPGGTAETLMRERSELEAALREARSEGEAESAHFIEIALQRVALQDAKAAAAAAATTTTTRISPTTAAAAASRDLVWLYQEAGGQMAFLCPLNMKMLNVDTAVTKKPLPREFTAPLLESAEVTQSEETRHRFRLTAYLPLATVFRVVELDLKGVVSERTMARFAGEVSSRAQRREREREELERERRIIQDTPLAGLSPVFEDSEFEPLPSFEPNIPPPPTPIRSPPPSTGEPTFAEIARQTAQRERDAAAAAALDVSSTAPTQADFPELGGATKEPSPVSPVRPSLVVAPAAALRQQAARKQKGNQGEEEEEEEEEERTAPAFAVSFARALLTTSAPQQPSRSAAAATAASSSEQQHSQGKGKQKRRQQLLLSNTQLRRF